ncbi:MAG: isochorismatase family protein [Chloroflexi bacterium]|nr:isochorismatase family protein [Chloroflexota bacterium]
MPKAKRERYFTPETIEIKSAEMMRWREAYNQNHPSDFKPHRSALLGLDLQAYFLEEKNHAFIPSSAAIIPNINSMVQAYARRNLPIFFTRHVNTIQDAGLMATWWRELIVKDNPLSEIDHRIDYSHGIIIEKSRYDAFFMTPLEENLRKLEVSQVVICGVLTHLCCETTARSAFMRGFEVYFTVDGTATYNEDFHRAALLNLAHGFAHLVRVRDILAALKENHEA